MSSRADGCSIELAELVVSSSSESNVSYMSSPTLPAIRKTRMKKHCSMSKSRCGNGALIGSLVVNVIMSPSMIVKSVCKLTKRVPAMSGMSSILEESVAIPSSLGLSDLWGVY